MDIKLRTRKLQLTTDWAANVDLFSLCWMISKSILQLPPRQPTSTFGKRQNHRPEKLGGSFKVIRQFVIEVGVSLIQKTD